MGTRPPRNAALASFCLNSNLVHRLPQGTPQHRERAVLRLWVAWCCCRSPAVPPAVVQSTRCTVRGTTADRTGSWAPYRGVARNEVTSPSPLRNRAARDLYEGARSAPPAASRLDRQRPSGTREFGRRIRFRCHRPTATRSRNRTGSTRRCAGAAYGEARSNSPRRSEPPRSVPPTRARPVTLRKPHLTPTAGGTRGHPTRPETRLGEQVREGLQRPRRAAEVGLLAAEIGEAFTA